MRVSDIMTVDLIRVAPDATLNELMNLMDAHAVRHLPVVVGGETEGDGGGDTLKGIVSQRDLLLATGWLPFATSKAPVRASDVLEPTVHTVSPEDSVVSLALELELRRIGCMPVVDGDRLVGMVTETDVLRCLARGLGDADPPVSELMTPSPVTTTSDALAAEAEARCREFGFRHLPVVDDDQLVGVLSDRDLRKFRGRQLSEKTTVGVIMTSSPQAVEETCRASQAAQAMVEQRLGALPVTSGGRVVGILSVTDLLEHCQNHLREDRPSTR